MDNRSVFLPTLKQLRYLSALNDTRHFGKAAAAQGVSQSTLSAGILELENLLGVTLVERTKRSVRFTPLGERIAAQGQSVLDAARVIVEMTRAAQEPLTGELRLGVIPTIAPYLLPRVLPGLRAQYPKLRLILREGFSRDVCAALNAGEIDCVLLALPYACGDATSEVLFEDPFEVALLSSNPLAAQSEIAPEDLDPRTLLLLEDGHCLRDHALSACSLPGLSRDEAILGTSLMTLVQMVANGLGVTLLPRMAIDGGIVSGTGLATRPLGGRKPSRTIGLVWRKSDPRTQEFQALACLFRELTPRS